MRFCSDVRKSLCGFGHVDLLGSKVGFEEHPEMMHKQSSEYRDFMLFHNFIENKQ